MRVKSLEIIRKEADLTEYRMAEMLGISQTNYQQIVSGKIKSPSSKVALGALQIARLYGKMSLDEVVDRLSKDMGISADKIEKAYQGNKKHKGMAKR